MGYQCDNDPGTPAVLLITMLENGDTIALCGPCVNPWASAIAAATDPGDVAAAQAAVDDQGGDGEPDDGGDPADQPVPYELTTPPIVVDPNGQPGPSEDSPGSEDGAELASATAGGDGPTQAQAGTPY